MPGRIRAPLRRLFHRPQHRTRGLIRAYTYTHTHVEQHATNAYVHVACFFLN